MRRIGQFEFPDNPRQVGDWREFRMKHALAMRVLAVAHTRVEGTWRAYVDAVPGMDHRREAAEVFSAGTTLPEAVALILFPAFEGVPYRD